jgi:hypothetical protein
MRKFEFIWKELNHSADSPNLVFNIVSVLNNIKNLNVFGYASTQRGVRISSLAHGLKF